MSVMIKFAVCNNDRELSLISKLIVLRRNKESEIVN